LPRGKSQATPEPLLLLLLLRIVHPAFGGGKEEKVKEEKEEEEKHCSFSEAWGGEFGSVFFVLSLFSPPTLSLYLSLSLFFSRSLPLKQTRLQQQSKKTLSAAAENTFLEHVSAKTRPAYFRFGEKECLDRYRRRWVTFH
jgi:hypothetical protein